jgi:hypothetical protein
VIEEKGLFYSTLMRFQEFHPIAEAEMKMAGRLFLTGGIGLTLLACNFLWNSANRNTLEFDVKEALDPATTAQLDLKCSMIETTRSGYCLFDANENQIKEIAAGLDLDYRLASFENIGTIPPVVSEGKVGCLDENLFSQVDGLPAYSIGGRPDQLSLTSGGQFEYFLLLFNPETGQACAQVSYAYG